MGSQARRGNDARCGAGCGLGDAGLQWRGLGNPTGERSSFNAQPTAAVSLRDAAGRPYVVLMADNWLRAGPRGLPDAGYIWLPFAFQEGGGIKLSRLLNWTLSAPFASP